MGYRSDVAYIILFDDMEQREAFKTVMRAEGDVHMNQALDEVESDKHRPVITFKAFDVKWYSSYSDVQAHERLYRAAYDLYGARYRFVALGEDGRETFEREDDDDELYEDLHTVHSLNTTF